MSILIAYHATTLHSSKQSDNQRSIRWSLLSIKLLTCKGSGAINVKLCKSKISCPLLYYAVFLWLTVHTKIHLILSFHSSYNQHAVKTKILLKSTAGNKIQTNEKVTVKGKPVNRGGSCCMACKYTFEGNFFSITWLKNKLAKEDFQVEQKGSRFKTNNFFVTTAHCGYLERINHNERLIINISFVISVEMMDRFNS